MLSATKLRPHPPATAIALSLAAALAGAPVQAADYPTRPIRYVVGFAPGGINDILARIVGQKLNEAWGQPVIVDNRPGAGGNLGAEIVARATPDGHTVVSISTAHAIAQTLYPKLNYKLGGDLLPVVLMCSSSLMLAVYPGNPAKTVNELVAWAKGNPLTYASGGVGAISHLSMEMFKQAAKINATHVPYKGAGPASADLMAGHVQVMSNAIPELFPFVKSGKLRSIGVMTESRHPFMPEVPTFAEQGYKEFVMSNWAGIAMPAGGPPAVVNRLAAEVTRIVRSPDTGKRLAELGFDPRGGTPEAFGALIRSETARFGAAVKASGAKVD